MPEVSLFRLYVLRAMYLLMAVGIAVNFWPHVLHHTSEYAAKSGAEICLLAGIGAMAALGVRYPLRMLPILLFEFFWKATWMLSMAVPLWAAHQSYPGMQDDVFAIGMGVVLCPLVIPWGYFFREYVRKPAERWR